MLMMSIKMRMDMMSLMLVMTMIPITICIDDDVTMFYNDKIVLENYVFKININILWSLK